MAAGIVVRIFGGIVRIIGRGIVVRVIVRIMGRGIVVRVILRIMGRGVPRPYSVQSTEFVHINEELNYKIQKKDVIF